VDTATGQASALQLRTGVRHDLTADGRTLMIERLLDDADVWLMEVRR
jgi:hypothetical protein